MIGDLFILCYANRNKDEANHLFVCYRRSVPNEKMGSLPSPVLVLSLEAASVVSVSHLYLFFFFFCIQQNKTLSGNNWAGSKGKRNFILGGLIPTSKALRWEQSTSIVGTWGLSCFMNSICLEHLRVAQWGRARFYFILAYSY